MKIYILLIFILLSTGCATVQPPIGNPVFNKIKPITDNKNLYAELTSFRQLRYICDASGSMPGYRKCGSLKNPWNSYVSLKTLKPAFSTVGHVCRTTSTFGRDAEHRTSNPNYKKVSECKPHKYYWESDLSWGELSAWLLIFPIMLLPYSEEVYFNYDAFNNVLEKAVKNFDREKFTLEFNNKIQAHELKIEQEKARKERDTQEKSWELNQRKALFTRNIKNKEIGSEVCSVGNRIGYVEQIAGKRIKVQLKGQVYTETRTTARINSNLELVSKHTPSDYFLFKSDSKSFKVKSLSELIWDDYNNWSTCDISGY